MDTFTLLQLLGWVTVGAVMFLFAATGGFDLGAGILLPFVAKTDEERRVVINIVGPTWDGNQVWLITAGGAIFAIWPRVYAASFSGLYFAILLVLWALFLRPVGFEYRSKILDTRWRTFWDWALFVGSVLPAFLIGVAMGNLLLGLPFHYDPITLRFFYTGEFFSLLHPFALLTGIVSVSMITMHGAAYIQMRSSNEVYLRCKKSLKIFSSILILSFALAGAYLTALHGYHITALPTDPMIEPLATHVDKITGGWLANYALHPWIIVAPIVGFLGAWLANRASRKDKSLKAFIYSTIALFGILTTFGSSTFPFIMASSTHPEQSLLVWNASSSALSLTGILICALIMVPIIFVYTTFVYRKLWGRNQRLSVEEIKNHNKMFY